AAFKWHSRPGAIERLSPPWDSLKVLYRSGGIEKGAEVTLMMKAGPFPYKWFARHTEYRENEFFRDEQIKGPFSEWIHTHRFEPDGNNRCIMEDIIEYRLPFHFASKFITQSIINKKLERIFDYRHKITAHDVFLHHSNNNVKPMTILISGASGLIGSAIIPFLTTGGHRVIRLVRKPPDNSGDEIFWDPVSGTLSLDNVGKIDAVLHLAGENLDNGRWTKARKKKIIESRVKGTELVSKAIAAIEDPPEVMLCASAIGFYGNRGDKVLSEKDGPGDDFISSVCNNWEKATSPALEKGIRTVLLRIGVVLTPEGGALQRLLLPFNLCLGGRVGSGRQYMSWIDMEDVIGAIYHSLTNMDIAGPVNVVSPNTVTNLQFTKSLGRILSRPTPFPLPPFVIKLGFGQMGKEILLSSTRVKPEVLIEAGYCFRNHDLDTSFRQMLGKREL
ncbi:MAG: TIGR01777 family oxidoreductase, partial [Deltaproteobacteria bacterium]|nr:TIGR01777 family oxidoreductase [Deltaproteobacteria bacterium]